MTAIDTTRYVIGQLPGHFVTSTIQICITHTIIHRGINCAFSMGLEKTVFLIQIFTFGHSRNLVQRTSWHAHRLIYSILILLFQDMISHQPHETNFKMYFNSTTDFYTVHNAIVMFMYYSLELGCSLYHFDQNILVLIIIRGLLFCGKFSHFLANNSLTYYKDYYYW